MRAPAAAKESFTAAPAAALPTHPESFTATPAAALPGSLRAAPAAALANGVSPPLPGAAPTVVGGYLSSFRRFPESFGGILGGSHANQMPRVRL